jgi:hypothetical protein
MADIIANRFPTNLSNKEIDFDIDTIKCALLKTTHVQDKDDNVWVDVSADEVAGAGYVAGGVALANTSVLQDDTNDLCKLDADDAVFSAVTLTGANAPQFAVIYDDTLGTKDIIGIYDFGSGIECNGGDFTVEFHADGMMKIEQGV